MRAMKAAHLLLATVAAMALLLTACTRRPAESEDAVRQAIEKYLATRSNLNMAGMSIQVGAMRFHDDRAEADVVFKARSDSKAVMSMHYSLRQNGTNWEVIPQGGGHPGATPPPSEAGAGSTGTPNLPPGHPSIGSSPQSDGLPPGHPSTGATPPGSEPLPPGHPPLRSQ
jgi:hypothetical protein